MIANIVSNQRLPFPAPLGAAQRGTAVLETALVLPVLMLILWGCMYFGRAQIETQNLQMATWYSLVHVSRGTDITTSDWKEQLERNFSLTGETVVESPKLAGAVSFDSLGDALDTVLGSAMSMTTDLSGARVSMKFDSPFRPTETPLSTSATLFMDGKSWTRDEIHGTEIMTAYEAVMMAYSYEELREVYVPF